MMGIDLREEAQIDAKYNEMRDLQYRIPMMLQSLESYIESNQKYNAGQEGGHYMPNHTLGNIIELDNLFARVARAGMGNFFQGHYRQFVQLDGAAREMGIEKSKILSRNYNHIK